MFFTMNAEMAKKFIELQNKQSKVPTYKKFVELQKEKQM